MKGRRVLISVFATCALAIPAAPAEAQFGAHASGDASCVGQFASTAGDHVGEFSALIVYRAKNDEPNFGSGVVAPYAHAPLAACP